MVVKKMQANAAFNLEFVDRMVPVRDGHAEFDGCHQIPAPLFSDFDVERNEPFLVDEAVSNIGDGKNVTYQSLGSAAFSAGPNCRSLACLRDGSPAKSN